LLNIFYSNFASAASARGIVDLISSYAYTAFMSYFSVIKKKLSVFGLLCVIMLFVSCIGAPVVFNEDVPIEKSAHIFFYPGLEVSSYNGITVETKKGFFSVIPRSSWRNMILPAGDMEFEGAGAFNGANTVYFLHNLTFKHNFEPGVYTLIFFPWEVRIYTDLPPSVGYPSEKKLVRTIKFEVSQR